MYYHDKKLPENRLEKLVEKQGFYFNQYYGFVIRDGSLFTDIAIRKF